MCDEKFITLKGDKNNIINPGCDKEIFNKNFLHCRGWWNMWSKGFITVAGHENKFINPEGDEK